MGQLAGRFQWEINPVPENDTENIEQNSLIRKLPTDVRHRLLSMGKCRTWEQGEVVYRPGQEIESVYFPLDAMTSVMVNLRNDRAIEVLTIGPDGFIGVAVLCGCLESDREVVVSATGAMLGIEVGPFLSLTKAEPAFRETLHHFMLTVKFQSSQKTACSQLHPTEQRLCWWLLTCADATGQQELAITQQHLSWILGVRRATVTEILQMLRDEGCISYRRRRIVIEDRPALIDRCCECYTTVESYKQQLLEVAP